MVAVKAISGDIVTVESDALLTTSHPGGRLFGQVDRAIAAGAGELYVQLHSTPKLRNGQVFYMPSPVGLVFNGVIFVIDDWSSPLSELVLAGLKKANRLRLGIVSLPLLRTGAARTVHEATPEQAVASLAAGVKQFLNGKPKYVREIRIVIYNNPQLQRCLDNAMSS